MNTFNNSSKKNLTVSIVIPCKNEEEFIEGAICSLINNDYPMHLIEIILVDGNSTDRTLEVVAKAIKESPIPISIIENKNETAPYAMNLGVLNSTADIIIRADAHSKYPKNYISTLVYYLKKLDAQNVGCAWETKPANLTSKAIAIALSLKHPFGVGNATYRVTKDHEDNYIRVDTVPYGCFKREYLIKIGLYDEELVRNQDNELNQRIINKGGKIYLIPNLKIDYYARDSYKKLGKMFFQYSYFGSLVDKKTKSLPKLRKLIPSIFLLSLLIPIIAYPLNKNFIFITYISALSYIVTNLFFSIKIGKDNSNIKIAPYLFLSFITSHFSYGYGYIIGYINNIFLKKKKNHSTSR